MSKEILDAIGVVAYEKGIDPEILFTALEDALLAAYRKTPHAKPFARVEFDRETGDIRVFTLTLTAEELEGHPGVTYPEPFDLGQIQSSYPQSQWPVVRTYTVRSFDPDRIELAVDFVVHGDQPCSSG